MSVREGDGSKLFGGGKNSQRAVSAFTEFRFCVLTADIAKLTHKLMREGEKIPISTTNRLELARDVFLSSQPNDELLVIISSLHFTARQQKNAILI